MCVCVWERERERECHAVQPLTNITTKLRNRLQAQNEQHASFQEYNRDLRSFKNLLRCALICITLYNIHTYCVSVWYLLLLSLWMISLYTGTYAFTVTFKSIQALKRDILYRLMLFILHLSVFLTPGVARQSHWPNPDLKPCGALIYTYSSTDFRGPSEGK